MPRFDIYPDSRRVMPDGRGQRQAAAHSRSSRSGDCEAIRPRLSTQEPCDCAEALDPKGPIVSDWHPGWVAPEEVIGLLDSLDGSGIRCWVDGGWGVDALLGRQTREHSDLDLVIDNHGLTAAIDLIEEQGYALIRDWQPTAIAFRREADGAEVDLHPVRKTHDGGGDQVQLDGVSTYHYGAPVSGSIAGRA